MTLPRPLLAIPLIALLAGCAGTGTDPTAPAGALVVSPDGSGSQCSTERPCSLSSALDTADDGEQISLLGGDYGNITADGGSFAGDAEGVELAAADGAEPVIGKLDLNIASTTWTGLNFTGGIYLDTGADDTRLQDIHVEGSGVFVHADGVVISGAVIENGTSIDGIQVGGASDLLIENSTVRGFGQGSDTDVHSDCLQIFDSSDIVVRGNYLGGCDNSALIFSPGGGSGIQSVLVEGNFIQGCVEKTDRCSQGTALDLREASAVDVVVRNNTILDGSVMVEPLEGLVFDRNIVGYVSNCAMPMTNSIVENWNTGKCDQPAAIGTAGNRIGTIEVVDRAAGDLRLVDRGQATIEPSGDEDPAAEGYGGAELSSSEAGAGG